MKILYLIFILTQIFNNFATEYEQKVHDGISIRVKRQLNSCTNGGTSLGRTCNSTTDCASLSSPAICISGLCCTDNGNGTIQSCSNGAQTLGNCTTNQDCLSFTNASTICTNRQCCLTSNATNNTNTCPNGAQTLGSCTTNQDCLSFTNASTICTNR